MQTKRILHILNKSPFRSACFEDCIKVLAPDDGLVLYADAVYAVLHDINTVLKNCFVLKDDLDARGLQSHNLPKNMQLISMDEFVGLCCDYNLTQSWY